MTKDVKLYHFGAGAADGSAKDVALLGGKGAHLAEMSKMGVPVPPGFTIPTDWCLAYEKDPSVLEQCTDAAAAAYLVLSDDFDGPLLVSVRSGAPVSMPGMMDTILNVGLTSGSFPALVEKIGARAAYDCRRRLIMMLSTTAYGLPSEFFDAALTKAKFKASVKEDRELGAEHLEPLCTEYLEYFRLQTKQDFPDTLEAQLRASIRAVFTSWHNPRAVVYRDQQGIAHDMGTAVTVQTMVFGNVNNNSGSGVLFSRNPSTGANELFGEFLPNAQGEDVVAGVRTPLALKAMQEQWPSVFWELAKRTTSLEEHYKDMLDIEFTVQDQQLYILQCRVGKRSPLAKAVIAVDMMKEGLKTPEETKNALTRADVKAILVASVDPKFKTEPTFIGIPSNNGVVTGKVCLTAEAAVQLAKEGPVILVRDETDPDDIAGMVAAVGVLTKTGGATSHAAVVARALNTPCIVGCTALPDSLEGLEGVTLTLDGSTGRVWVGIDVPVIAGGMNDALNTLASMYITPDILLPASKDVRGYATIETVIQGGVNREMVSLVDCRGFVPCKADAELEVLFGQPATDTRAGVGFDWSKTKAIAPRNSWYAGEGLSVSWEDALTLEELLDTKSLSASPSLIKLLGEEGYTKLLPLLEAAGFKGTAAQEVVPLEYLLFKNLKE